MRPRDTDAVVRLIEDAAVLGAEIDHPQANKLLHYLALLAKWNRVVNLTAVDQVEAAVPLHLLDSLALVAPLRRAVASHRLLDAGSGAGLPGVVLAIAMPELEVTCAEAVAKKATFIRQAVADLGVHAVSVHQGRVELVAATFDVITSRAFASLATFVEATRMQLEPGGRWAAMKGKVPVNELAELPSGIEAFHVEQLKVPRLQADRCVVWMRERVPA